MRKKKLSLLQTISIGFIYGKLIKQRSSHVLVLLFTFSILLTRPGPITPTQATLQPTMAWEQTYGASGTDVANSLIRTTDGGFVLAGYTTSPEFKAEFRGAWLVKVNANGGGIVVTKIWWS